MRVFVTGATGWVGTAVVDELVSHNCSVTGLSRSAEKGRALRAKGVEVLQATLDDLDLLQAAARTADAVCHLAFDHDFSRFEENAAQDRRVIEALGEAVRGTTKPLIVTSGVAMLAPGRVASEADVPEFGPGYPRRSEEVARALATSGVRAATVRLAPSTHGVGERHGFVPILVEIARRTGVSAFIGEGANRWPAVHVSDTGRLYRRVLETGATEAAYHATAEEGVPFRDIAALIGRKLGVPVEPREADHFGWFAIFAGADMPTSSARTREVLDWHPAGPDLLTDLNSTDYYQGI